MPNKNQNDNKQQIDQKIDKALAQNEDWEETYGRLFEKKGKKKEKFSGGTLAAEKQRLAENKYYVRKKSAQGGSASGGEKPTLKITIKRK